MNHPIYENKKNWRKRILNICLPLIFIVLIGCTAVDEDSDLADERMQEFVKNISAYARTFNPNFIIIPQNGAELAFNNADPENELNTDYLQFIDGLGIEELFYNGTLSIDTYRLSILRQLKDMKKIMVSEYVSDPAYIAEAQNRNYQEGFICFVREPDNYHYTQIPTEIFQSNPDNITHPSQAKNYLYLISTDNFSTKQEMIDTIKATNYDIILIDLFFQGTELTPSDIAQLKTKPGGQQRLVISYISIGSAEKFRYYWQPDWKQNHPSWIKKPYSGYDDEFWIEFWHSEWKNLIYGNDNSYIKKIINAGFDGAYLDNVEAYYFLYND